MTARDFLHDDRAARPAILTVVIGAHLAALFILADDRQRAADSHARGSLVLIPSRLNMPPLSPRPHPVQLSVVKVDSPPQPALDPLGLPDETAPTGAAMAPPDWKQSGADAAADAARKNYRALGPRPEEPYEKAPRSPFKPPPRHEFGEVGEDVLENPVLWLSENCYVRYENRKASPGDPFANIPMTLCSFPLGKLEPRGDLFEHLRKTPPAP